MDLPDAALQLIADLLHIVENTGRWPVALEEAIVAMLTKGGTAEPDDRRPIVLLPLLYRLWASLRAQELQAWLREHDVLQSGQAASAETLAADFALSFRGLVP